MVLGVGEARLRKGFELLHPGVLPRRGHRRHLRHWLRDGGRELQISDHCGLHWFDQRLQTSQNLRATGAGVGHRSGGVNGARPQHDERQGGQGCGAHAPQARLHRRTVCPPPTFSKSAPSLDRENGAHLCAKRRPGLRRTRAESRALTSLRPF